MSKRRAFSLELGLTVRRYLIRVRIENAEQLLRHSDQPVKKVAAQVGYSHLPNFYQHFRLLTGHTPCQYRQLAPSVGPKFY